jgi:predicted nuclease of predicted toxin-antitoxin system
MRFLLDMNLSPALVQLLRSEGHDAIHLLDAGSGDLADSAVFELAAKAGRIVVTFDLDFGEIAGFAHPGSAVVLLRLRFARPSYVWDRLRAAIGQAAADLQAGAVVLVEDTRIRIRRMPPESG